MKKTVTMYILFFFTNSLVYALVLSAKKSLFHDNSLSDKLPVSFTVVGLLSVISILSYLIGIVSIGRKGQISKTRLVVIVIMVAAVSMVVDVYLLSVVTNLMDELHTNLLDRLVLSGFSQIIPLKLICPEED